MPADQVLYVPVPLDSVASSLPSMLQVSADLAAAAARPRPAPRPAAPSPPSTSVAAAAAARPRPARSAPEISAAIVPTARDAAPQRLRSRPSLHPAASALGDRVPPKAPGPAHKCAKGQIYLLKGRIRISDGKNWRCVHYRQPSQCQSCGGVGVCEHGKRRAACPECQSKDNQRAKSAAARGEAASGASAGTTGSSSHASRVATAGSAAGPRPPAQDPPTRVDVQTKAQSRDMQVTPATEAQTAQAAMLKRKEIGQRDDIDVQPPSAKKDQATVFWSQYEQDTLVQLVQEKGLGHWQRIAQLLGTNRSATSIEQYAATVCRYSRAVESDCFGAMWHCCARWCTSRCRRKYHTINRSREKIRPARQSRGRKLRAWTANETATLISIVQEHGLGNWEQKASALGTGRSASAVEQRYYVVTRNVSETRPTGGAVLAPSSLIDHIP